QICKTSCYWYNNQTVPVNIEVSDETPLAKPADILERLKVTRPEITVVPVGTARGNGATAAPGPVKESRSAIISEGLISDSPEKYKEKMEALADQIDKSGAKGQGSSDLLGFLLAGIFWGAISLITPCVFPMIPITVSFFLKQSEKEHHRPIAMASVYSLTIVIVLTLAAAFMLSLFRMLSIHPVMNYFIGGLFVFFALSLFGMY